MTAVADLLAENARLRNENERLRGELRIEAQHAKDWRRQAMDAAKMLATPVIGPSKPTEGGAA